MPNPLTPLLKQMKFLNRLDPERDWILLLIISVILLTSIVVWNAWTFDMIAKGGVIGSSATSTAPTLEQTSFEDIHAVFDKRAIEESNYTSGVYQYVDPSL
ncbi:MAG: hypothetical protein NTV60_03470 [Candidatus Kaiserbacteria bacterium]|nr:hypothetical protein [Candidatus Kaiserbacteria bacterium]